MNNYILTYFHHRGCVVRNPNPTYQREVDVFGVCIDKDHFTLVDLLSYTKDLGYTNVKGFYCEDNNELVQVTSDIQLLEFVKDLIDGDELHMYVVHEIDELEELPAPTSLLTWYDPVDEYVGINTEETVENEMKMIQMLMKNYDPLGMKGEKKRNHNLRKKKNPTHRKKKTILEEVPIGEAGVDRGFEYIGINKNDRYVDRLGGDHQYIDSSECDSDDSTDMLDVEAVRGVDLTGRRKSKNGRHDDEGIVAIFELGMFFENAKEFRKALEKYVVEKNYQIKLRPNEAHRVRAKCKFKEKCKWLFYGAIDRDCEDLQLGTGQGLTVMLDMQKGLHDIVDELLPNVEVRREKLHKMSRLGKKICDDLLHYPQVSWVGVHTSQPTSHNLQFTGQSSQGSSHPEPRSSYQHGPIRFNQPASTTSSNHASSTTVCGDTIRVKRARETAKSSQPPPFVDTSITVIKGITSQLPPRTRQTAGQKRERVATREDFARGGPKRPTNGGSSNVGFGIYTSASGIQILNDASSTGIDLGFKPRGLRWKNKDVVATSQLQQMANKKKK
ncbi:hypothetical protein KY290_017679 [Solanum tuberosum]|uniref:Transposase MuDR plant domain-containing protein n=1 Tax=Solanum tuberosum TaxID=4113 RepID=A0ABQ7VC30_SOLTU|nr:hypothetical protein KY285_016668 [Solanum tuberosum]KAH0761606.1 hypothetical protein KY290_017679 [Solanum tuberosum]